MVMRHKPMKTNDTVLKQIIYCTNSHFKRKCFQAVLQIKKHNHVPIECIHKHKTNVFTKQRANKLN